MHIDSLPELTMPADLLAISPLTEQTFEWPPTSSFRAYGHIRQPDPRLRPAMNGNMDVIVNRMPNAISIPAKAVFTRNGKPIVYVAEKGAYRAVEVELLARNPDEVAVKGIPAGAMVTLVEPKQEGKPDTQKDEEMMRKIVIGTGVAALVLALLAWGGSRLMKAVSPSSASRLPVTRVKRGDVTITVTAKGELAGGHTEMLSAPMTGGGDMAITYLREPGELVAAGDVVVKFDTTEQEYKLKEAEADLAEAEQQVIQTQADNQAKEEETRYALLQAKTDVRTAELEARRNPILADIVARENTLALEAAKDHLRQLEHDAANRQATSAAAVAIQEAARNKAKVKAETARQNIENMVLKAKAGGYVSIMPNTNANFFMTGMHVSEPASGRHGERGHGGGADSGFEELGSDGQHRRTGSRPPVGGPEGAGGDRGAAGQIFQRHSEGDRRHGRARSGTAISTARSRWTSQPRACGRA